MKLRIYDGEYTEDVNAELIAVYLTNPYALRNRPSDEALPNGWPTYVVDEEDYDGWNLEDESGFAYFLKVPAGP